jgi:hypothetical protein
MQDRADLRYSVDSIVEVEDLDGKTIRTIVREIGPRYLVVEEIGSDPAEDGPFSIDKYAVIRVVGFNW